jgi:cephalosporin hydroxylase
MMSINIIGNSYYTMKNLSPVSQFECEKSSNISRMASDPQCRKAARDFILFTAPYKYSYNSVYLGRPLIQFPQDILAIQEIIWSVKPDLIIETGVAHGGSIVFSASLLSVLDIIEAIENNEDLINPRKSCRKVVGIDIDIRPHNRAAIEAHPMFSRIQLIEGSSTADEVVAQVHDIANNYNKVLVLLDSCHTHDHVLSELDAYAPLVSLGSYCIVFDTIIEDMPASLFPNRAWGPGNNPKTAVLEYLKKIKEEYCQGNDGKPLNFKVDKTFEEKYLITVAPDGYLQRF